jgi:sporulation and cell division protein SsgA
VTEPYCQAATAALLLPDRADLRFPVWLTYHPWDCFAVRLTVWTVGSEGATWIFSWELLAAGLTRTAGEGDVRVAPEPAGDGVVLALGCHAEPAYLEFAAADVERFVKEARTRTLDDRRTVGDVLEGELDRILDCA